jgi:hypothetical protein
MAVPLVYPKTIIHNDILFESIILRELQKFYFCGSKYEDIQDRKINLNLKFARLFELSEGGN